MLVSCVKKNVFSEKGKSGLGIEVLFHSCFILCEIELQLWLYGFVLILEFTQEVREWTLSWDTLPWSTQCDRAQTRQTRKLLLALCRFLLKAPTISQSAKHKKETGTKVNIMLIIKAESFFCRKPVTLQIM